MTQPTELRCALCGYDVTATVDSGISTCPECGAHITRAACEGEVRYRMASRVFRRWVIATSLVGLGVFLPLSDLGVFVWLALVFAMAIAGSLHTALAGGTVEDYRGRTQKLLWHIACDAIGVLFLAFIAWIVMGGAVALGLMLLA